VNTWRTLIGIGGHRAQGPVTFAAPEVATGKVTDACYPRYRHEEFLRFLKHVAEAYPRVKLHLVCDSYGNSCNSGR
jgi:hypothetical protein